MTVLESNDYQTGLVTEAACPRCGYDLRGTMETWRNSCPLTGICSECGLAFQWVELLNPQFQSPHWHIEYVSRWKFVPLAVLATAACSLVPWFFWSKLRISHEIKWRRLAVYMLALAMIAWLMFATSNAIIMGRSWVQADQHPQMTKLSRSLGEVVLHAFFLPWSNKPILTYTYNYISQGVPKSMKSSYAAPLWLRFVMRWNEAILFYLTCFIVALPMTFVLLPISRRRARVRWRHIVRVFAYSLLFPALVCMGTIINAFWAYMSARGYTSRLPLVHVELTHDLCLMAFVMLALWWWVAIRRYLRMEEAWKIGLSVIVTSFMLATVAIYFVDEEFARRVIGRILFPFGA